MATRTWWESFETHGTRVVDKVKELIKEGNIRRIRIRQRERVVAEFPLTVGVVGAVFAPVLAAIGAITALVTDCTLEVEREAHDDERATPPEEQAQEAERV
ncbi:MAG TPA: DUF4342 domain-containing protein [Vicinamibacterales bacterium]|jgi:hypothetical protein|nr:DUF4342 domain-containing protein [Vicinamibacterales bacterium]